jgi:hypothetical protein
MVVAELVGSTPPSTFNRPFSIRIGSSFFANSFTFFLSLDLMHRFWGFVNSLRSSKKSSSVRVSSISYDA